MAGIKGKGGQKGRSGRKSKAEEAGVQELFDRSWPMPNRVKVIQQLHKSAMKGNDRAAALLLAYVYGKPTEKHEHSGESGDAIQIVVKHVQANRN